MWDPGSYQFTAEGQKKLCQLLASLQKLKQQQPQDSSSDSKTSTNSWKLLFDREDSLSLFIEHKLERENISVAEDIFHDDGEDQDSVIIISSDSESQESQPKRQKVEKKENVAEEEKDIQSGSQVGKPNERKQENFTNETQTVGLPHPSSITAPHQKMKQKTDEICKSQVNRSHPVVQSLKESSEVGAVSRQDVEMLQSLSGADVISVFTMLGDALSLTGLTHLCSSLQENKDLLGTANCTVIVNQIIHPKLQGLKQVLSRQAMVSLIQFTSSFPTAINQSLIVPFLRDHSPLPPLQADILLRLFHDGLSSEDRLDLLSKLLEESISWDDSQLSLLQVLVDTPAALQHATQQRLMAEMLAAVATRLQKSIKFGKLLLSVLQKLEKDISPECREKLAFAVSENKTFLKRAIEKVLKKL